MTFPDFLNKDKRVQLPVGGDFAPTGLIAPWQAGIAYSFLAELDEAIVRSEGIAPALVTGGGSWHRFYFATWDECRVAIEKLDIVDPRGNTRRPDSEWRFEAPSANIINLAKEGSPFGDPAAFTCRIMTLRSKKYRHELHMIALPAAIAAYANVLDYKNPGFDLSELLDRDRAFTDEFQREMIGDPDSGEYADSVLWKRRADLWSALGEPKAQNYNPLETGTKFDTTSEQLSNCLSIITDEWTVPVWGRLLLVPDPRVDAVYTSGEGEAKRLSVPALVEMFSGEASAKVAAESDRAGASASPTASSGPKVPEVYREYPDLWKEQVAKFKEEMPEGPPPVVRAAIEANSAFRGIDPEIVEAWL